MPTPKHRTLLWLSRMSLCALVFWPIFSLICRWVLDPDDVFVIAAFFNVYIFLACLLVPLVSAIVFGLLAYLTRPVYRSEAHVLEVRRIPESQ